MRSQRSQGTPAAALLKVGLMGSLLLPGGPAGAAMSMDDARRSAQPEEAAEEAADAPAAEPAAEAAPKRKRGGKARSSGRNQQIRANVEKAEAERRPLQDVAQKLLDQDNPEGAASMLAGAAEGLQDPVLHLEAADAYQRVARKRSGQAAREQWDLSLAQCEKAEAALMAAESGALDAVRVDPGELETLRAWVLELRENAKLETAEASAAAPPQVDARPKPKRNPKAELIAGSILLAGGVVGLGVMGGGFYLNNAALREYEKAEGRPDVDTAPLVAQQKQGFAMIAAGAVTGVIGVALGVTFVALGAHDLKVSRRRVAQVRVAPTCGGLSISGRF